MRRIISASLTAACMLSLAVRPQAADQNDARAIIDKAIKAAGGAERLATYKGLTGREKGTYYGVGDGVPYESSFAVQWPNRFKLEIVGFVVIVVNNDQGWMKMGDQVEEMTKERLEEHRDGNFASWVTTLTPLKDKDFTFATLGEIRIEDRPAVGVKVSHKDRPDVSLYFDKETHRLVKSEARTKQMGEEALQETFWSDYKEIDGLLIAGKVVINRDGKKFVEAERFELKPVSKLEDDVFSKP